MSQTSNLISTSSGLSPTFGGVVNGYFTPLPSPPQRDGYVVVADPNQPKPVQTASDVKDEKKTTVLAAPRLLKGMSGGSRSVKPIRLHLMGAYGSLSTNASGWLGASFCMNDVQTATDFPTFKSMFDSYKLHGVFYHFASIAPATVSHSPLASAYDVDNYGGSNASLGDIRSTVLRYTTDSKTTGVKFHHSFEKGFSRSFKFPLNRKNFSTDGIIGSTNTLLIKPGQVVNVDNGNAVNVGTFYIGNLAAGPTSTPLIQYVVYWDVEFLNRS